MIHRSTVVVTACLALLGIMIVIPGLITESGAYFAGPYSGNWTAYQHGWPFVFLERTTAEHDDQQRPPWLDLNAWKLAEGEHDWVVAGLIKDTTIFVAVSLAVAALWEWRRRHRDRWFQMRLADLFVLTALIAAPFGYWRWLVAHYSPEARIVERVAASGHSFDDYETDGLLQRIAGNVSFGKDLYLCRSVRLEEVDDATWAEDMAQLERLNYLELVSIDQGFEITPDHIRDLAGLSSLRVLDLQDLWENIDDAFVPALAECRSLREIRLPEEHRLTPDAIGRLRAALPECAILIGGRRVQEEL